jgi:PTH1 family peptidyl-tRNA hydrolase
MSSERWLIAGLGNPGPEYSHNRHNVGYWCVNRLARQHGISLKTRSLAAIGEGQIGGSQVVLLKPRTYVNNSGHPIAAAMRHHKVSAEHLLVLYDELDLPTGKLRLKAKGGHGGHNGLRSIVNALGSSDFPRIRIGIGRPNVAGEPTWDPKHVAPWVLGDPTPEEVQILRDSVARAAEAVETIIAEGVEAAMRQFNT